LTAYSGRQQARLQSCIRVLRQKHEFYRNDSIPTRHALLLLQQLERFGEWPRALYPFPSQVWACPSALPLQYRVRESRHAGPFAYLEACAALHLRHWPNPCLSPCVARSALCSTLMKTCPCVDFMGRGQVWRRLSAGSLQTLFVLELCMYFRMVPITVQMIYTILDLVVQLCGSVTVNSFFADSFLDLVSPRQLLVQSAASDSAAICLPFVESVGGTTLQMYSAGAFL